MLSGKEDKEVEEDLSWSHKSLDGVFRSFIGSSGVRVHYLGPQYVSPIFLFFFFLRKTYPLKQRRKNTQKQLLHTASIWITSDTHWGISSIQTNFETTLMALQAKV